MVKLTARYFLYWIQADLRDPMEAFIISVDSTLIAWNEEREIQFQQMLDDKVKRKIPEMSRFFKF